MTGKLCLIWVHFSEIQPVGVLAPFPVPPRAGLYPPKSSWLTHRVVSDLCLTLSEPPGAGVAAKSHLVLEQHQSSCLGVADTGEELC